MAAGARQDEIKEALAQGCWLQFTPGRWWAIAKPRAEDSNGPAVFFREADGRSVRALRARGELVAVGERLVLAPLLPGAG